MRQLSLLVRLQKQSGKRSIRTSLLHSPIHPLQGSDYSCHLFSSLSQQQQEQETNDSGKDTVLLYERDAERNKLPRAAFGFSILNSTYWLWYVLDFIPAVNASPVADLHINPAIGVGGLALGAAINVATGLYPSSLISKLAYNPTSQKWYLWKHDLPWIRQSSTPVEYPLGSLQLTTASSSSSNTQRLLQNSTAAAAAAASSSSSYYKGHLGIKIREQPIPMLLEIRESSKVLDPPLLLQALLDPHALSLLATTRATNDKRFRTRKTKKTKRKNKQQ
jgi:hypothetical protein